MEADVGVVYIVDNTFYNMSHTNARALVDNGNLIILDTAGNERIAYYPIGNWHHYVISTK